MIHLALLLLVTTLSQASSTGKSSGNIVPGQKALLKGLEGPNQKFNGRLVIAEESQFLGCRGRWKVYMGEGMKRYRVDPQKIRKYGHYWTVHYFPDTVVIKDENLEPLGIHKLKLRMSKSRKLVNYDGLTSVCRWTNNKFYGNYWVPVGRKHMGRRVQTTSKASAVYQSKDVVVTIDYANFRTFTIRDADTKTQKTYSFTADTVTAGNPFGLRSETGDIENDKYISIKQIETRYRSNWRLPVWPFSTTYKGRDGNRYKKAAEMYFIPDPRESNHFALFANWVEDRMYAEKAERNSGIPIPGMSEQSMNLAKQRRKNGSNPIMGALEGFRDGLENCGDKIKSFVNKHGLFGPPASKKRVGASNPPSSGDTRANRKDHDEEKTREPSAPAKASRKRHGAKKIPNPYAARPNTRKAKSSK